MESIQQVIDRFDFQGKTADCRAFGNGHINTTYIITTDLPEGGQQRYVLQKVNHNVFRDIDRLMQNVFAVTSFLQEKIRAAGGDPDRETPALYQDQGWRAVLHCTGWGLLPRLCVCKGLYQL